MTKLLTAIGAFTIIYLFFRLIALAVDKLRRRSFIKRKRDKEIERFIQRLDDRALLPKIVKREDN